MKNETREKTGHSTVKNGNGTITVTNDTLRVTLPEAEFRGRYDVFNRAMRTLGNRSELKLLESEMPTTDEITDRARQNMVFDYLSEHCRYNLIVTLKRMTGGHVMSPGMQRDVDAARAYADGVLSGVDAAPALSEASEQLLSERAAEMEFRVAGGRDCANWEIEIVGKMPEQIGMCRYAALEPGNGEPEKERDPHER